MNERAEERVHLFGGSEVRVGIICECADIHCQERIVISKDAYEQARTEPTHFIVKPGHIVSEVEKTVSVGEGFEIIRKRGLAADVVRYLSALPTPDPTSD